MSDRRAVLLVDSWAGRREYPVEIINETPKRYRVRVLEETRMPHGKHGVRIELAGGIVLVPKTAIRLEEPQ